MDELALALDEYPRVDHRPYLNHFTVMPSSESMQIMAEYGIHVAISSDILPIGPMVGIYAAVTRKGMSGRIFAAEETRKGNIEAGKLADMIVLDQDILTVDPVHILDIQVEQTWLGGKLVYENAPAGAILR